MNTTHAKIMCVTNVIFVMALGMVLGALVSFPKLDRPRTIRIG